MSKFIKIQSVEPNIADLANGWLKSYRLDYKLEQESLNTEIDNALNEYASKTGGSGGFEKHPVIISGSIFPSSVASPISFTAV